MRKVEMEWFGSEDLAVFSGIATYKIARETLTLSLPSFEQALSVSRMFDFAIASGERDAREHMTARIHDALNA